MAKIIVSGDTSGSVTIEAPAIAGSPTLTLPTTSGTVLTTASTTGINASAISTGTLAQAYGGTGTTTGYYGFKNRIINGAMVIDQRNAGASVTFDTSNKFIVDRFYGFSNVGTTTAQRSTTAPADFINSVLVTQSTGGSVVSGSYLAVIQQVEGLNITDFNWGTANAKTVTLSFWVRSSITGAFSVALSNSAGDRTYVSNYTINSANTFEQKTITIPGDTGGTWLTTNGRGVGIIWNLGYGSSFTTSTLNSWITSGAIASTTATTSFASTTGATFYITGVQLEVGTVATSFDYRPYGTELALCQRYYEKYSLGSNTTICMMQCYSTSEAFGGPIKYTVTKRATPTITLPVAGSGTNQAALVNSTGSFPATIGTHTLTGTTVDMARVNATGYTSAFTAGNVSAYLSTNSGTAVIEISAEL